MILTYDVFDEVSVYPQIAEDLAKSRGRVVIYVPFAPTRRVKTLESSLKACIKREVKVCCYLQQPRDWDSSPQTMEVANLKDTIAKLQRLGAHVTLRPKMHEKLVVIDEQILYDGSLNVLSHFDTSERMTRHKSPQLVRDAYKRYNLTDCRLCFGDTEQKPFAQTFGQQIKTARKLQGLSQRQFAQLCGMHQCDISEIEAGRRTPSLETISVMLDVLQLRAVLVPQHLQSAVNQILAQNDHSDQAGIASSDQTQIKSAPGAITPTKRV